MSFSSQQRGSKEALSKQILFDNPVAYWKCDETSGTTFADYSGNGLDLTLSGSWELASGSLLGDDSKYAGTTTTSDTASRTGTLGMQVAFGYDWSVEAVVMVKTATDATNYNRFFVIGEPGETEETNYQMMLCRPAATNTAQLLYESGPAATNYTATNVAPIYACRPLHIVATYNHSGPRVATVYVNGQDCMSAVTLAAAPSGGTSANTYIGAVGGADLSSPMWIGHVAVYKTVLSTARILQHFRATGLQAL